MRYICPVCERPYTPTQNRVFPRHGRVWFVGRRGEPSGWRHCDGSGDLITESTRKHDPKRPGGR